MNYMRFKIAILYCMLLLAPVLVMSQDTVRHQTFKEVEISAQRIPSVSRSITPMQVVDLEKIERSGVSQLSEVLQKMAGLTIKDYGGIGGIKTVSARGLGSQFSLLSIDGVAVNDYQNGQVDMGRYLLGNTAYVSFANGQEDNLFQSARAFASGNVIQMQTRMPDLWAKNWRLKVSLEGGSYGYLNPTLVWDQKIGKRMALSVMGSYMNSKGDYPFTLYYTPDKQDSSSHERRKHSEVRMGVAEANWYWQINENSQMMAKIHWNKALRNLPGPVVYYNQNIGTDRTLDELLFGQVKYEQRLNDNWRYKLLGKVQGSSCVYEDTAANGMAGVYMKNEYHQQEYYLSGVAEGRLLKGWKMSLALDGSKNDLQSNMDVNNEVTRWSGQGVLATSYEYKKIGASANVLGTLTKDYCMGETKNSYQRVSPYVGAWWMALQKYDSTGMNGNSLRVRYFFKENYRVPTFNDLYYFLTVPHDLKPERALQHNLGLSYMGHYDGEKADVNMTATLDGYYNMVRDKLVAMPTNNLFFWTMMNIGEVNVWGIDAVAEVNVDVWNCNFSLSGNYSYQYAVDVTDVDSKTYKNQIVYTPRHSGGVDLYVTLPWFDCGYTLLAVGKRYCEAQNDEESMVKGYLDHGITLRKEWILSGMGTLELQAKVMNLANVQYEVVRSYPMMGTNYKIKLVWNF